jgi:hypothetical protein
MTSQRFKRYGVCVLVLLGLNVGIACRSRTDANAQVADQKIPSPKRNSPAPNSYGFLFCQGKELSYCVSGSLGGDGAILRISDQPDRKLSSGPTKFGQGKAQSGRQYFSRTYPFSEAAEPQHILTEFSYPRGLFQPNLLEYKILSVKDNIEEPLVCEQRQCPW